MAIVASLCAIAVATAVVVAFTSADDHGYSAEIRRTEYGIPHILADDYGSLGYGYGYAFAQDNLCVLADRVVTLRGDRSRYFGPTAGPRRPLRRRRGRDQQPRERRLLPGCTTSGSRAAAARTAGAARPD
jgi:Penicillin amidase